MVGKVLPDIWPGCRWLPGLIRCGNGKKEHHNRQPQFWQLIFHSRCLENKVWSGLVSKSVIYYIFLPRVIFQHWKFKHCCRQKAVLVPVLQSATNTLLTPSSAQSTASSTRERTRTRRASTSPILPAYRQCIHHASMPMVPKAVRKHLLCSSFHCRHTGWFWAMTHLV